MKQTYLTEAIVERVKQHFKDNWKTYAKLGAAAYAHNRYVGWDKDGKAAAKINRDTDINKLKQYGKDAYEEGKYLLKDTKHAASDAVETLKKPIVKPVKA